MGRPPFVPKAEQSAEVSRLTEAKVSIEKIASVLGIAPKTLRKHFATELGIIPAETVKSPTQQGDVLSPAAPAATRQAAFVPSLEQRERVKILAGARISDEEIARKMDMPVGMLTEHFGRELEDGPATCKADIIEAQYYAGRGGNVAAAKVYLTFNAQVQGDEDKVPAEATNKGKKEIRQDRAEAASGGTGDNGWGNDLEAPSATALKH